MGIASEPPKTRKENLIWRRELIHLGQTSDSAARSIRKRCQEDFLFWMNAFAWGLDPRCMADPVQPFVTYLFQDRFSETLAACVGRSDLWVRKSRDQGATFLVMLYFYWLLRTRPRLSFKACSRNAAAVDRSDDPDCLFAKVDLNLTREPPWLFPTEIVRSSMKLYDPGTRSALIGDSTTENLARGGRPSAMFIDEFAAYEMLTSYEVLKATQNATRSRIVVSTPRGCENAYYEGYNNARLTLSLHWTDHPVQRMGLYIGHGEGGKIEHLDPAFWETATVGLIRRDFAEIVIDESVPNEAAAVDYYPFIADGKSRSPYYDNECARARSPAHIAQELDMDFLGSSSPFFDAPAWVRYVEENSAAPLWEGEITLHEPDMSFAGLYERKGGRLKLWAPLDGRTPPTDRQYVIGGDVSTGSGASNSCLSVADTKHKAKFASFVACDLRPEQFADYAHALGRFFTGLDDQEALIGWECQGPGHQFGSRLVDLGYGNMYYHVRRDGSSMRGPGWPVNDDSKRNLLTEYGRAVLSGEFTNRDKEALEECLRYRWEPKGKIAHVRSVAGKDGSGASANHGDRAVADAIAWMLLRPLVTNRDRKKDPRYVPEHSLAGRMLRGRQAQLVGGYW